jgi:hypothetical protein
MCPVVSRARNVEACSTNSSRRWADRERARGRLPITCFGVSQARATRSGPRNLAILDGVPDAQLKNTMRLWKLGRRNRPPFSPRLKSTAPAASEYGGGLSHTVSWPHQLKIWCANSLEMGDFWPHRNVLYGIDKEYEIGWRPVSCTAALERNLPHVASGLRLRVNISSLTPLRPSKIHGSQPGPS